MAPQQVDIVLAVFYRKPKCTGPDGLFSCAPPVPDRREGPIAEGPGQTPPALPVLKSFDFIDVQGVTPSR